MEHKVTAETLQYFEKHLHREERSEQTIEKYVHDVTQFALWLGEKEVTKVRRLFKLRMHA